MPYHNWGDDSFDWNSLHTAIHEIMEGWRKWGRIGTHGKEKFGCFRDHAYPFSGALHSLTHPGYVYSQYPKWLWRLDIYVFPQVFLYTGIGWVIRKWQEVVYNYFIQKACRKYPHIIDELVADLGIYEWVQPGIFGDVDGTEIHGKYWRRLGGDNKW